MGFFDSLFRRGSVNVTNFTTRHSVGHDLTQFLEGTNEEYAGEISTGGDRDTNEEYAAEISTGADWIRQSDSYSENGVRFDSVPDVVKVVYDGILARDGAQDVYAVVGFGSSDRWDDIEYHPMTMTGNHTFELMMPLRNHGDVNIAFKDGADHWDNNSGRNYSFSNVSYRGS